MWLKISGLFILLLIVATGAGQQELDEDCPTCLDKNLITQPKSIFTDLVDSIATKLVLKLVELLRESFLDVGWDHIPVPDLDWELKAQLINVVFHIRDNKIQGLTDFMAHNVSVHVFQLSLDLDVEIPFLEWTGTFDVDGSAVGIPISGGGPVTLRVEKIRLATGGQVKYTVATSVSLALIDPTLKIAGLTLDFQGIMGGLSETDWLLILIAALIVYAIVIVALTIVVQRLWKRYRSRKVSV